MKPELFIDAAPELNEMFTEQDSWDGSIPEFNIIGTETNADTLLELLKEGRDAIEKETNTVSACKIACRYAPVACLLHARLPTRLSAYLVLHLREQSGYGPDNTEFWSFTPAITDLYDAYLKDGYYA